MVLEKLFQGQPEGIFGIGYNDPSTVGIICTVILLILVFSGVRVVFAASIAVSYTHLTLPTTVIV